MIDDVNAEDVGPQTRIVFEFLRRMERLVAEADGTVGAEYWAPLTEMVAVDEFERCVPPDAFAGADDSLDPWSKVVMGWDEYLALFSAWAPKAPPYDNSIRRIAEFPGLVYLEIEEHHGDHDFESLSVYELNDDGLLRGIRVGSAAGSLVVLAP